MVLTISLFQKTSARGSVFSASSRAVRPTDLSFSVSNTASTTMPVSSWKRSRMGRAKSRSRLT
jgi:hypothetical protein